MTKISEMTNKQLKEEFDEYNDIVNGICYGVKDLMWLSAITREIEKRGGEISTRSKVSFNRIRGD